MEIEKFEGADVTEFEVKFPAMTVETDMPYRRGTVIRMAVEARVKGVNLREDKDGNVIRTALLGLTDISVVSTYNPETARDMVGGSLAGGSEVTVEVSEAEAAALGLPVATTAGLWPPSPEGIAEALEQPS